MKKFIKRLKEKFAPVDKVFPVGFTALTVATFDFSLHWLISTLIGIAYVVWRIRYA